MKKPAWSIVSVNGAVRTMSLPPPAGARRARPVVLPEARLKCGFFFWTAGCMKRIPRGPESTCSTCAPAYALHPEIPDLDLWLAHRTLLLPWTQRIRYRVSPQNENVRFVQSRNVRFHGGPRAPWKRSESL